VKHGNVLQVDNRMINLMLPSISIIGGTGAEGSGLALRCTWFSVFRQGFE
jgi:acetyl-CoA carboxylase alpha subunit